MSNWLRQSGGTRFRSSGARRDGAWRPLLWALAAVPVILAACSGPQPYAASTNRPLTEDERREKAVLDAEDQGRALAAMRSVAEGQEATEVPQAATDGVPRWSDLEAAVAEACNEIEAAVVETIRSDDGEVVVFRLKTVEDWPGELVVHRVSPPVVYDAQGRIGRLPDLPGRADRAAALVAALDRYMAMYGKKRKLGSAD